MLAGATPTQHPLKIHVNFGYQQTIVVPSLLVATPIAEEIGDLGYVYFKAGFSELFTPAVPIPR